MKRFGRRVGQSIGAVAAIIGALIAGYAMVIASLWLLCFATFVSGLYNAFGVSLRFAAADVADAYRPSFKARAISLVLTGGIVGGIIGPEIARWSRTALPQEFAGTYLMLGVFALASLALVQLLRMPSRLDKSSSAMPARSLAEILRQPAAVIAIASAAFGYGVMNLLMVATPLAMEVCSLPFDSAVFVLQWHIVGMFGPGLVTGSIISRVGVFPVIAAGAALMLGCVVVALSGVELMHFTAALFLLGVGWNFLYTGGTTLLTTAYRPHEKNKVQGFMDLCVFGVMVSSSASSGALLFVNGWSVLNLISLPFVLIVLVGAIWAASRLGWRVGQVRAGAA
jgi:MFS family permease